MDHQHDQQHDCEPASFWRSRYGVGLIVLGSVAGYFLWTEHRAHLAGALPFVLLLACPLMHVFMHHGHGHGQHGPHRHGSTGEHNAAPAPKTGDRP